MEALKGTFPPRILELLRRFEASDILLIEWEISLLQRLGYPLVPHGVNLFFFTPDEQLQRVRDIAAELSLYPADEKRLPPAYTSEFSGLGLRYVIEEPNGKQANYFRPRRLVVLPLSWTGINRDELVPLSRSDTNLPCTVWTVPLSNACITFVRLATRAKRGSCLRMNIFSQLAGVIGYSLFDMSYEGDYMELPSNDEPLSEKEIQEMENAVREIRGWAFRSDEEWMREALVDIVTGQRTYESLPHS